MSETGVNNQSFGVAHPLSLKMPALLIRIVTVPNASIAVLMTAAPFETDEVFTTAFPPAKDQGSDIPRECNDVRGPNL